MDTVMFKNKEAFLEWIEEKGGCLQEIDGWAREQKNLQTILKTIDVEWRVWCLCKGAHQFAEDAYWEDFCGNHWMVLCRERPEYAIHADWSKLSGTQWRYLLVVRQEFIEYCDRSTLSSNDWYELLSRVPALHKYADWANIKPWVFEWLKNIPAFKNAERLVTVKGVDI